MGFRFSKEITLGDLVVLVTLIASVASSAAYMNARLAAHESALARHEEWLKNNDVKLAAVGERQTRDELEIQRNTTIIDQRLNIKP